MGPSLDYSARLVVKFGGIEADDSGEGLAVREAAIGAHQLVGVPRRNLDMIAEHSIMPDLQRADCGRITISSFERSNGPPSVGRGVAQCIEVRVIAFGDVPALRPIERRR